MSAADKTAPPWIESRLLADIIAAGPQPDPYAQIRLPGDVSCPRHWRLTFGKHRGKRLCDVPAGYVRWLAKQDFLDDRTRTAVEDYGRVYRWTEVGR